MSVMRPNIYAPEIDQSRHVLDGYHSDRARVGAQAGAERLGISVWELDAGQAAYPYHFHLTEEEALIVLDGRPSLRTPEGTSQLDRGDVVVFPRGEHGAHQVINDTSEAVRFIAISTSGEPDIVLYPDTGKIGATERRPDGSGIHYFFRIADAVDYYDGMEPR